MRKSLYFLLLLLYIFPTSAHAQDRAIEAVPNQPSTEAYDLLKDSKGYLWVAHEFGISRYDGSAFVNFHHPLQNSLSMSEMLEDKKGRIWCHNFSGQIFYIENLQLHLLSDFRYEEEQGYPRIVICGDELVATSAKGIFTHNLTTGRSQYHRIPDGTKSLTRVGNRVVLAGSSSLYMYEAGKPVTKLFCDNRLPVGMFHLQNESLKDTFYCISNPERAYYKMTLEGDTIRVHEEKKADAFINTITVSNQTVWVNTKERSFTEDGKQEYAGMNLSDVVQDRGGHIWMSSLKKGLCVQYNAQKPEKIISQALEPSDNVRRLHTENNQLLLGTINGNLYRLKDSASLEHLVSVPKGAGAIEQIAFLGKEKLILAASVGLYIYNTQMSKLQQLQIRGTVKDIVVNDGNVYLACIDGIRRFTPGQITSLKMHTETGQLFNKTNRCRSLAFASDSLVAVYSDGVFILHKNTIQPLLYNGKPIYAARVRTIDGRVVIGTFNQGLIILENGKLRSLTKDEGLAHNFIRDIKTIAGDTWLIYTDRFQKLNKTFTGAENYSFPFSEVGGLIDFSVLNRHLYTTSGSGIYRFPIHSPAADRPRSTRIDKITIDGKEIVAGNSLEHFQNHLRFHVSTPFFSPYSRIVYRYRIANAPDSTWQWGVPGQNVFDLIALEPGTYQFEIVATDENKKLISQPTFFRFQISPPWHQQWLIRILFGLVIAALGFHFVRLYYGERLRKQRLLYEKQLAIQAERHRISAEIHDDMGAGLSAIRLLAEMTKNKLPDSEAKAEVGKLYSSVSELSYKMREVVWSLNADNDSLENLLHYIRRQALALFENSVINLRVILPADDIPPVVMKGQERRHIYLSVKEALHNCLKHSGAKNCLLTMRIDRNFLRISITDDGQGFNPASKEQIGYGLTGMKERMQQIEGQFKVDVQEMTKVEFTIPLKEKA